MKWIFTLGLLTIFLNTTLCQVCFRIEEDIPFPDLTVRVGENVPFPDIKIKVASDVNFADFSIGITTDPNEAHFIILKSDDVDFSINAGDNLPFPDFTILANDNMPFPDVTIRFVKNGEVDFLVYSEKDFICMKDLVIALLPVIRNYTSFRNEKMRVLFERIEM